MTTAFINSARQMVRAELRLANVEMSQGLILARRGVSLLVVGSAMTASVLVCALIAGAYLLANLGTPQIGPLSIVAAAGTGGWAFVVIGLKLLKTHSDAGQ